MSARLKGLLPPAVFGALDGLNGTVGLVLGMLAAGSARKAVATAFVAAGVSNAVSMAHGEVVAVDTGTLRQQAARMLVMFACFLVAALAPPAGFLFSVGAGFVSLSLITPAILFSIIRSRAASHGWRNAILVVMIGFLLSAGAGYLAALV